MKFPFSLHIEIAYRDGVTRKGIRPVKSVCRFEFLSTSFFVLSFIYFNSFKFSTRWILIFFFFFFNYSTYGFIDFNFLSYLVLQGCVILFDVSCCLELFLSLALFQKQFQALLLLFKWKLI